MGESEAIVVIALDVAGCLTFQARKLGCPEGKQDFKWSSNHLASSPCQLVQGAKLKPRRINYVVTAELRDEGTGFSAAAGIKMIGRI